MAKAVNRPLEYINLHLLKSGMKPVDAIVDGKDPKMIKASTGTLSEGQLFFHVPRPKPVAWRDFLRPAFGASVDGFQSQHVSAVLFFSASSRVFAATFGYGRSLLAEGALEADFGLRTALNLCDPRSLRAVDYRTIEERTRIGRVQLSDEASVGAFRMDLDTDLLRGLEARSKDTSVCERLGARWSSLTVGARAQINDLPVLASKLLQSYRKRKLPQEFAWIDNVMRVNDATRVAALDAELESRLDGKQHAGIRLAIPEITGGMLGVDAKLFKPDGIAFDSGIGTYIQNRPGVSGGTIHAAKHNHRVFLVDSASGAERHATAVYRCLVAEIEYQKRLYLLADGEWFVLDRDFVQEVDAAVGKIKGFTHGLPPWMAGEREDAWNARACNHCKDAALLDKSKLQPAGAGSGIEPADLCTTQRVLGHVKRRDKNSGGLSHLFSQGFVSAELLAKDPASRRRLAAALPRSHAAVATELRSSGFRPEKWTIGYVVLGANPAMPGLDLPFFSRVNLRKHAERLALMNYRVRIIGV